LDIFVFIFGGFVHVRMNGRLFLIVWY